MRSFLASIGFLASISFFAGCAVSTENAEEPAVESRDEALRVELLHGAYSLTDAEGPTLPRIESIVFSADKTFFASVDTGIRCFRAPCPSQARLDGAFRQTKRAVTLSYEQPGASRASDRFTYTIAGDTLVLVKEGSVPTKLTFAKQGTFCLEASDCENQSYTRVTCTGHTTCSESNACGYACGSEPKPRICFSQSDCGDDQNCQPGICKMYCLAGDDNCCAPSLCIGAASEP